MKADRESCADLQTRSGGRSLRIYGLEIWGFGDLAWGFGDVAAEDEQRR